MSSVRLRQEEPENSILTLASMKLFALPLAKLPDKAGLPLFYLHAQRLNPPAPTPPQTTAESLKTLFSSDVPLATRATEKAASFWNAFGEAKAGSWKRRVYVRHPDPAGSADGACRRRGTA